MEFQEWFIANRDEIKEKVKGCGGLNLIMKVCRMGWEAGQSEMFSQAFHKIEAIIDGREKGL